MADLINIRNKLYPEDASKLIKEKILTREKVKLMHGDYDIGDID